MSVTFHINGRRPDYDDADTFLNLANTNARDLLHWLGFDAADLCGQIPAPKLARRCRERLRLIAGNIDPAKPFNGGQGQSGARFIYFGRREGYLHDRCEELLRLAESAGHGEILYG
ncbi:MAG: hypothetical protein M3O36_18790 [Myxococcota bacterium]|nr:hypothetical protein [Myxococcota bacterium]